MRTFLHLAVLMAAAGESMGGASMPLGEGVPEGFEETAGYIEFPPSIDWLKQSVLSGTVTAIHEIQVTRNGEKEMTKLMVIQSEGVPVSLWESAGLVEFFRKVQVGFAVWVKNTGTKKIVGKPSPMREFQCAFRRGKP